jgi:hypothetical protein
MTLVPVNVILCINNFVPELVQPLPEPVEGGSGVEFQQPNHSLSLYPSITTTISPFIPFKLK